MSEALISAGPLIQRTLQLHQAREHKSGHILYQAVLIDYHGGVDLFRSSLRRELDTLTVNDDVCIDTFFAEVLAIQRCCEVMKITVDDIEWAGYIVKAFSKCSTMCALCPIVNGADLSLFQLEQRARAHVNMSRSARLLQQNKQIGAAAMQARVQAVCFEFEKHGKCRFGSKCKFEHKGKVRKGDDEVLKAMEDIQSGKKTKWQASKQYMDKSMQQQQANIAKIQATVKDDNFAAMAENVLNNQAGYHIDPEYIDTGNSNGCPPRCDCDKCAEDYKNGLG